MQPGLGLRDGTEATEPGQALGCQTRAQQSPERMRAAWGHLFWTGKASRGLWHLSWT